MKLFVLHLLFAIATLACDDCYGPQGSAAHVRNVRRMQPDARGATVKPRAPLEWGQLNFLQTTDTHGWLAGFVCNVSARKLVFTVLTFEIGISKSRTTAQIGVTMRVL